VIHEYAPELESILRMGVLEWLQERLTAALDAVFDTLAPVPRRGRRGLDAGKHFTELSRGCATPGSPGAGRLLRRCPSCGEDREGRNRAASPVIDRREGLAGNGGGLLQGVVDRLWSAGVEFLKKSAGDLGEDSEGRVRGSGTRPSRPGLRRPRLQWFKNWLGIGEARRAERCSAVVSEGEAAWNW